jgi:3-isopropylmalate dehydrogenase
LSAKRYAIVPGDGIGVEVTPQALRAMEAAAASEGLDVEVRVFPFGADHYLETGETLPEGMLDRFLEYDGLFMGAFGDPRVPDMRHAREILLATRFGLDLYANFRPVRCPTDRLCPLRGFGARDIDLVVFRENTEGSYVGVGGIFKKGTQDEVAIEQEINTRKGVERIIRLAFEYAREAARGRVTMSDKSNAMRHGHDLWQRTFHEIAEEYDDIESNHLFIDALAMELVRDPRPFEVIVTGNLFGDIITDLGAALQGGMGMATSANLHPGRTSMFEPVHGSAPDIAGQDVANPFGAVLTVAMMLEATGCVPAAERIERAVRECLEAGECTRDIGGTLTTTAAGDAVVRRLEKRADHDAERATGRGTR